MALATGPQQALRTASDTRLPWTLRITSVDPAADLAQGAGRRRLLLVGLAMMGFMVLVGGYFTTRAVSRELAVSRLQSDFVSAVSHEFRTPLTSMLHLTDSLDRGIVSDEDRRRQYYAALAHETARLHRLVKSLLNFGRMEAGAVEYRFEPTDIAVLAGDVVATLSTHHRRVFIKHEGKLIKIFPFPFTWRIVNPLCREPKSLRCAYGSKH